MRLIDADAIPWTDLNADMPNSKIKVLITFADKVNKMPTIEPKKGKWIKLDMHAHLADHKCTACGQECYVPTCMGEPMYAYCPNCGADMREGEADG